MMALSPQSKRRVGVLIFTLLYPALAYVVVFIPNPMVPGASVALNMILPVLAGYFYGSWSGGLAGGAGTAIAALLRANQWDGLAILPHALMGFAAGWAGRHRADFLAAATLLVGHGLNMLFYVRLGKLTISPNRIGPTLMGLAAETTVGMVAVVLVIAILQRWLYQDTRW